MSNDKIRIAGELYNISSDDPFITDSSQIKMPLYDGTFKSLENYSSNLILTATGSELGNFIDYVTAGNTPANSVYVFLCTEASNDYEKGHFYLWNSGDSDLTDITGSASTSSSDSSTSDYDVTLSSVVLSNGTVSPLDITFKWSSNNSGNGTAYLIVDGTTVSTINIPQGSGEFSGISVSDGTHKIVLYVKDSANEYSKSWSKSVSIGSASLTVDLEKTYAYGSAISLAYTVKNAGSDTVKYSIDSGSLQTASGSPISITGLSAGIHQIATYLYDSSGNQVYSSGSSYFAVAQDDIIYAKYTSGSLSGKQYDMLPVKIFAANSSNKTMTLSFTVKKDGADYTEMNIADKTLTNGLSTIDFKFPESGSYILSGTVAADSMTSAAISLSFTITSTDDSSTVAFTSDDLAFNLIADNESGTDYSALWSPATISIAASDSGWKDGMLVLTGGDTLTLDISQVSSAYSLELDFIAADYGTDTGTILSGTGISMTSTEIVIGGNTIHISPDTQYRLSIVCNGTDTKIYLNGVLTRTISSAVSLGTSLVLGGNGKISIESITLYNDDLATAEVENNYLYRHPSSAASVLPSLTLNIDTGSLSTSASTAFIMNSASFESDTSGTNFFGTIKLLASTSYPRKQFSITLDSAFAMSDNVSVTSFILIPEYQDSSAMIGTSLNDLYENGTGYATPAQEYLPALKKTQYGFPVVVYDTTGSLGIYDMFVSDDGDIVGNIDKDTMISKLTSTQSSAFQTEYPNWTFSDSSSDDYSKFSAWLAAVEAGTIDVSSGAGKYFSKESCLAYYVFNYLIHNDLAFSDTKWISWGPAKSSAGVTYTTAEINSYGENLWYPEQVKIAKALGTDDTVSSNDIAIDYDSAIDLSGTFWEKFAAAYASDIDAEYASLHSGSLTASGILSAITGISAAELNDGNAAKYVDAYAKYDYGRLPYVAEWLNGRFAFIDSSFGQDTGSISIKAGKSGTITVYSEYTVLGKINDTAITITKAGVAVPITAGNNTLTAAKYITQIDGLSSIDPINIDISNSDTLKKINIDSAADLTTLTLPTDISHIVEFKITNCAKLTLSADLSAAEWLKDDGYSITGSSGVSITR